MEPVTHALGGAVMAFTLPRRLRRWWFPLWAAAVAASPDLDVLFVHNPLQYIEYHRGITHSLLGGPGLALLAALMPVFLTRRRKEMPYDTVRWTLPAAWGFACLLIFHHIWLDCMNSYGTQVFLPFSDYRVRWNALFIVDILLLLPLLAGVLLFRNRQKVMVGLLLWTLLYPLGALGIRLGLETHLKEILPATGTFDRQSASTGLHLPDSDQGNWQEVRALHLVPDAFSPFHWKLILDTPAAWDTAGYSIWTELPHSFLTYAKPSQKLWQELGEKDRMFHLYQRFAVYPAVDRVIDGSDRTPELPPASREWVFSDLRFGSTISFVDDIQTRRNGEQINFRIMARLLPDGAISAVRFVTTTGVGGDSGWQPPTP